ncbi:MAG: peptide chain release factor 1, partial [Bacteroidota bacterium]
QDAEVGAQRRNMVGSGDRSDKIRTYNYPQGRVTDHRVGLSVHNLPAVMDGSLDEIVEALRIAENASKMEENKP